MQLFTESLSMNATLSLAFERIAFNFEHDLLKFNLVSALFLMICVLENTFSVSYLSASSVPINSDSEKVRAE